MQLVTKIALDKNYQFFLKHLFHTGMYGGTCCMYSLPPAVRWGGDSMRLWHMYK